MYSKLCSIIDELQFEIRIEMNEEQKIIVDRAINSLSSLKSDFYVSKKNSLVEVPVKNNPLQYYKVANVALILGRSEKTVKDMTRDGRIKAVKVGKCWIYDTLYIDNYMLNKVRGR